MAGRHIAVMLPNLKGGGAERVMMALADGFALGGDQVDLVLLQDQGQLAEEVPSTINRIGLQAPGRLRAVPKLANYLRTARPDGFISAMASFNCLAILARQLAGVPTRLAVTEHSTLSHEVARNWYRRVLPPVMERLYPRADAVVAVSQGVADDLAHQIRMPRSQVEVIYNVVVTDQLLARAEAPLAHPWFEEDAPPVILGVGRLVPQKDFGTLIRAFNRVRERLDARLMILGDGEDRVALEALVADLGLVGQVRLEGFVSDPMPYFARSRLFVLSSRWEGFGNVLVEAMAAGLRVVSTDCPNGPREVLDGTGNALVPVGDVGALAEAVVDMLEAPLTKPYDLKRFEMKTALDAFDRVLFPPV